MFVKFDKETKKIIAGAQAVKPDDTWIRYFPANRTHPRQACTYEYVEQMDAVIQILGEEYNPNYFQNRIDNYERIGEQLDKLWHDIDNGTLDTTGSFYKSIKTIKDNYPK